MTILILTNYMKLLNSFLYGYRGENETVEHFLMNYARSGIAKHVTR